eukprot:15456605-Alexandrium_andersonii.AAC.1
MAIASSSSSRPAPEEPESRPRPAHVGAGSAGAEARAADISEQMSDIGEQELPDVSAGDIDEEMGFLMNLVEAGAEPQEGSESPSLR